MTSIIEIRNYDFDLPAEHTAFVTGSTVRLEDGDGAASEYGVLGDTTDDGERRIVLDPSPPRKVGRRAYPLTAAAEELSRLLERWDAKFGDRSEYTRLRSELYSDAEDDWRPLFNAMRDALNTD